MKSGRRKALVGSTILGIVGCSITLYGELWAIILGRVIFGIACGVYSVAQPKYTQEHLPIQYYELVSPFFVVG